MRQSNQNPFFTVVVPLHNKISTIDQALKSIQLQTFNDFEIIIVDDASTDSGINRIKEFPRLINKTTILKRDYPGNGGYAARNLAAAHAKGAYLTFLDADDIWFPNHLESARLIINKSSDFSLICTSHEELYQGKIIKLGSQFNRVYSRSEFLRLYSKIDLIHTNSVIISTKNFRSVGGFPEQSVKRGGDHLLWLKLVLINKPLFLTSKITSRYCRDHSGVVGKIETSEGIHPVTDKVKEIINGREYISLNLSSQDIKFLKQLANRKQFHWLLHRRAIGLSVKRELKVIFWEVLNLRGWMNIILLICPPFVLSFLFYLRKNLSNLLLFSNIK